MHVEAWLARAAAAAPDEIAIVASDGTRSYAELLRDACSGAVALREGGVRPGERVAISLPAGLGFAQALHACLLMGAVAVPLDLRLAVADRARIAQDAALIVEEPLLGAPVDRVDGAPERRHDLDATAVVIHTSGTTSAPRPVELTYGNFLWSALGSAVALGLDPGERWLCALPLSHVGGLSILIRSAIYGTTAVLHERFDTERVLGALSEQRITLVSLVATTLARLLDAGLREPPALRCALTGGGPVPPALVARARAAGVPVYETYGLTECCSQAATAPGGADRIGTVMVPTGAEPAETEPIGAGVSLFCTKVEIARDGEILLSGPTVAPGALAADGWLHTGDLGRLDEHGLLHVTGRKTDTIVTGGENVSPTEVEAAIEAHPEVIEAVVLGRPDPEWGEAVHAIVVVQAGASVEEAQLREHCRAALAPFKVPKRFALVSEPLPRTPSGKLLRRKLQ